MDGLGFRIITSQLHRASHVFRYSSQPVVVRECVAEHSYYVAMYSMILSHIIKAREKKAVDPALCVFRALCHDIDECLTGDVIRPVKHSNEDISNSLYRLSTIVVSELSKPLDEAGGSINHYWSSAKSDDINGVIVRVSDFLAVVRYLYQEVSMGNSLVDHIIGECIEYGEHIQIKADEWSDVLSNVTNDAIDTLHMLNKEVSSNET